jgi:outer membrane murein-binding lipoprotein Lpp
MKNLNLKNLIIPIFAIFCLMDGCYSCKARQKQAQVNENVKTLKKKVDSLENYIAKSNEDLYKNLSKEIEMLLIIENEIDGKNKKSIEIKEIIKDYK